MDEHKRDVSVTPLHGLTEDPCILRRVCKWNQV